MSREAVVRRTVRTPWQVLFSVWHALFMREAVARLMAGRLAWLWLLVEPMAHALFLTLLFSSIFGRSMPGVDFGLFVLLGLMGWKFFNVTATRCMNAVDANRALFNYRQVLPVDTVLVRAALEGFLLLIVSGILLLLLAFIGKQVVPADPMRLALGVLLLWLLGAGLGMVFAVTSTLVPDSAKLVGVVMRPLYFMSGIMYSVMIVPEPYRGWLMLNPVLNGVECMRTAFFPSYFSSPDASLGYVAFWALCAVFLGLALQVRHERQLVTR